MGLSLQCVLLFPLRYPCLFCFPCSPISPLYLTVSSSQIWQYGVLYVPQFNHICIGLYSTCRCACQIFRNRLRRCSLSMFNFLYDFYSQKSRLFFFLSLWTGQRSLSRHRLQHRDKLNRLASPLVRDPYSFSRSNGQQLGALQHGRAVAPGLPYW